MDLETLYQGILTIGFPGLVAIYALWVHFKHLNYLEQTLGQAVKDNTQAINELKILIVKLAGEKEGKEDDI